MAIKRGPDGRILSSSGSDFDEPTKVTEDLSKSSDVARNAGLGGSFDADTVIHQHTSDRQPDSNDDGLNPATVVVGSSQQIDGGGVSRSDPMADPVVGWLVVINGPGKGHALAMGYGRNSVGRDASNRLSADFGDAGISRGPHCIFTFDPKSRKFFLQPGEGTNLTYYEDEPVLQPLEISSDARVQIGRTTLRFIQFCDSSFDWQAS